MTTPTPSPTPETDALRAQWTDATLPWEVFERVVRKLERERDAARAQLAKVEARLHWLHDYSTVQTDPDGYEWGIYRVKWKDGNAVSVLQTNSDFSDLDAEMLRESEAIRKIQELGDVEQSKPVMENPVLRNGIPSEF